MKKGRAILIAVFVLIFIGGIAYALYPTMAGCYLESQYTKGAETFLSHTRPVVPLHDGDAPGMEYQDLLQAMQAYNEIIYTEGQSGLCDAWAYTQPSFDLTAYGIEAGIIGVISIPAIGVEMPIYLGATGDNMAKGAVHLSQTSLPIGGDNTNCVIAGHCGWKGADYFRYLSNLELGDTVTVTNLWETLTYEVCGTAVIEPSDIDAILILPGKDMLTLITCHPYASGGRYRYVVYCERV